MIPALASTYPESRAERDRWIVARRSQRNVLDPLKPYAFFSEEERSASGEVVPVATILLTNRECPWRCLMCDLWQNTLTESVPLGAIPAQIDYALAHLPPARQIKLYNSGSFFDPRAIPLPDYPDIASRLQGVERVIVESHPALIGENCFRFRDHLQHHIDRHLEVAMGLETVHPNILERLNKGLTIDQFAAAAERLQQNGIDLRVFLLVKPPFMEEAEALAWTKQSIDFSLECGATAIALIPTRGGNGAMEDLARTGDFAPPTLATLEAATEYGLSRNSGRVFADLWDTDQLAGCPACHGVRIDRLRTMNLQQVIPDFIHCEHCGAGH